MVIRQRAIQAEDKQERQQAILDAAARLLARSPDRIANVAEVADEAGLAKGTVYLYFPSKEELLLAVHERNIDGFFRALIERLALAGPVTITDIMGLTHKFIVEPPLFLPLAARCFGLMGQSVPLDAAIAFKQRMGDRLAKAGAGIERHFPVLKSGDGVSLLRHSYALIIGLWQMSAESQRHNLGCPISAAGAPQGASPPLGGAARSADRGGPNLPGEVPAVFQYDYPEELDRALLALWGGTVDRAVTAGATP